MIAKELMEQLESLASLKLQEPWDNAGFLIGYEEKEVKKIFVALDLTEELLDWAIANKVDFIITHHPLMFQPVKRITQDDFIGRRVIKLIEHGINYYVMHTNFDCAVMAKLAAEKLGLTNASSLDVSCLEPGAGMVGHLPQKLSLFAFCQKVKQIFALENVRVYGDLESQIKTVAVLPGSGKGYIEQAIQKGADVYLTGDIGHHDGIDANERGLSIIDAGHYGLEKIFITFMEQYLKNLGKEYEIITETIKNPFRTI